MRAVAVALLVLAGCAGGEPLPRPAGGYQAIRFMEPLKIPGPLGVYEPGAGAVLVADRASRGRPLFCGTIPFRDLMTLSAHVCATFDGQSLTLGADKVFPGTPFRVPPGTIEETRL